MITSQVIFLYLSLLISTVVCFVITEVSFIVGAAAVV
jgi:hypothetical protein